MITKVASIHFSATPPIQRNYRGQPYRIKEVPFGAAPEILTCRDLVQRDWGSMLPGTNKRQEHRWMVLGEEIAADMVREWTENGMGMTPDCHPGIWVVRDRLPMTETVTTTVNDQTLTYEERLVLDAEKKLIWRDATPEEAAAMWEEDLARARRCDRAYAEWCWLDGNRMASEKRGHLVPPNYKKAARHYGLEAEWLKEAAASDSITCGHCGKLTMKGLMLCSNCHEPLDLERWAKWKTAKDAALLEAATAPAPKAKAQPVQAEELPPLPPPVKHGISNRPAAV